MIFPDFQGNPELVACEAIWGLGKFWPEFAPDRSGEQIQASRGGLDCLASDQLRIPWGPGNPELVACEALEGSGNPGQQSWPGIVCPRPLEGP